MTKFSESNVIKDLEQAKFYSNGSDDVLVGVAIKNDFSEPLPITDATAGIIELMVVLLESKTYDKYCKRTVVPDIFYDFYNNGSIFTTFRVEFNDDGWCVFEENFLLQGDGFRLLQNGDALTFKRNS